MKHHDQHTDDCLTVIGGVILLGVALIGAWIHSLPDPPVEAATEVKANISENLVDERPEDADPYCNRHVNRSLK